MYLSTVFYCFCLFPCILFGKIIETAEVSELKAHVKPGTLLLCDLDNTLIEPAQMLGSVHWAEKHLYEQYKQLGLSEEDIYRFGLKKWNIVQASIPIRLVDPRIKDLLTEFIEQGIPVLGLTARQVNEMDFTHKQLSSVGIEFSQDLTKESRMELSLFDNTYKAIYDRGVLFSNLKWKKSHVLQAFLKSIDYSPTRIVIIDDRMSHVQDIETAITAMGIECIGIRYSATDKHIEHYDPKIAEMQWAYFPYILSDDEARQLIYKSSVH